MVENIVSIETEDEKIAAMIERRVIVGEREVIDADTRLRLREETTKKGVELILFGGNRSERIKDGGGEGRSSRQAKELEIALGGRQKMIDYCQKMLTDCVSEARREASKGFVARYYENHIDENGVLNFNRKKDLLKNRLEAIISATHSMFELIQKVSDEQALEYMVSNEFCISFRERELRGWEKAGGLPPQEREVPRIQMEDIRTLPVAGLKKIVEYWLV